MGESANAVPRYQKLRTRVTHIWGNRKGQQHRSAMVSLALGEPPSWSRYPLCQVSMIFELLGWSPMGLTNTTIQMKLPTKLKLYFFSSLQFAIQNKH